MMQCMSAAALAVRMCREDSSGAACAALDIVCRLCRGCLDTTKAQVVILGTGKAKFERMVEQLDKQNPNLKVRPFHRATLSENTHSQLH